MGFDQNQKATALLFARTLANRDYVASLALCSSDIVSKMSAETLGAEFERIVPLDWGEIDPIDLEDNDAFPFVYVVLGGDIYSEAIIINSFVTENGQTRIANFQLGRP
jgi:hypothetical protein